MKELKNISSPMHPVEHSSEETMKEMKNILIEMSQFKTALDTTEKRMLLLEDKLYSDPRWGQILLSDQKKEEQR